MTQSILKFAVKKKCRTERELDFFVEIASLSKSQHDSSPTVYFSESDLQNLAFEPQSQVRFSVEIREFLERLHDPTDSSRRPRWLTQGGNLTIDKQSGKLRARIIWTDNLWADLETCLPLNLNEYRTMRGLLAKRQYLCEKWSLT